MYVCVCASQRVSTLNKGFNSRGRRRHRRSDRSAAGEWWRVSFPAKVLDSTGQL